MADFCNKCSEEMGFPRADIDVYTIKEKLDPGCYVSGYICEGCGFVGIAHGFNGEVFVLFEHESDEGPAYKFVDYDTEYKGLNITDDE